MEDANGPHQIKDTHGEPGDFGGNAHRVQDDIRCKVLAALSTVK